MGNTMRLGMPRSKSTRKKRIVEWVPGEWAWCLTLLFMFIRFFTQISTVYLYVTYTALMVMLALLHLNGSEETSRVGNVKLNGAVLGLCFSILVILAFSPYSKEQLVKFCLLLMDVYILVAVLKVNEMESATKVFYWASMVVVAGTFVMYLVSPAFFSSIEGAFQGLFYSPVFFGVPDNNDTAVAMFLLVCLAYKKGWKTGLILGSIYPFLYFGRQYILMCLIVVAPSLLAMLKLRKASWLRDQKIDEKLTAKFFYCVFAVSTIVIIGFSYFWVNVIVEDGTSSYKESLNDSSNAIRMNSNVYCFELMTRTPDFLFYGYDSDVFDELGISSTDYSSTANYLISGRYRLVQPHEEVLNLVLKEGLLFAIFYYFIVAHLLSKIKWGEKGKAILVAFFIGSLFLSGFFRDFRLLAFVMIGLSSEIPLRSFAIGITRNRKRTATSGQVAR